MSKQYVQDLQNVPSFEVKKAIFSSKKSEDADKYITKTLLTNRKIVAKDYVKREMF